MGVWAVVPVKELDRAKERLAPVLPPERRRALMLAMLEDVLTALAATTGLSGLAVVTLDAAACRLAARYGARIIETGARDGHSGAVAAAARLLAAEGCPGMLTLPGDIPLVTPAEITQLLAAHRPAPAFTITATREGRTRSSARRPTPCPFALARTAFSRICGRPRHAASARPCCACRALRSMSIRRRIWPL